MSRTKVIESLREKFVDKHLVKTKRVNVSLVMKSA